MVSQVRTGVLEETPTSSFLSLSSFALRRPSSAEGPSALRPSASPRYYKLLYQLANSVPMRWGLSSCTK